MKIIFIIYFITLFICFICLIKGIKELNSALKERDKAFIDEIKELRYTINNLGRIEYMLGILYMMWVNEHNIPIYFDPEYFTVENNLDTAAGVLKYKQVKVRGKLISNENFEIHLRYYTIFDENIYATIGHEIGHYIAINSYNDDSEQAANNEAYKLAQELLSEKEFNGVKEFLQIMFDQKEKEVA